MSSILPSLSTAIAGAAQPNSAAAARDNVATTATAATIAVSKQAADKAAKSPESTTKSRAPAAQKRTEAGFAGKGVKPRPSQEGTEEQGTPSSHDGKLDVVA